MQTILLVYGILRRLGWPKTQQRQEIKILDIFFLILALPFCAIFSSLAAMFLASVLCLLVGFFIESSATSNFSEIIESTANKSKLTMKDMKDWKGDNNIQGYYAIHYDGDSAHLMNIKVKEKYPSSLLNIVREDKKKIGTVAIVQSTMAGKQAYNITSVTATKWSGPFSETRTKYPSGSTRTLTRYQFKVWLVDTRTAAITGFKEFPPPEWPENRTFSSAYSVRPDDVLAEERPVFTWLQELWLAQNPELAQIASFLAHERHGYKNKEFNVTLQTILDLAMCQIVHYRERSEHLYSLSGLMDFSGSLLPLVAFFGF